VATIDTALRRSRGQALAEVALMLPFLVLAMMGLFDVGRAFYYQISITNAGREATRLAVTSQYFGPDPGSCPGATCPFVDDAAIKTRVQQELSGSGITVDSSLIVVSPSENDRRLNLLSSVSSYPLSVTVTYRLPLITPILSNLLGSPITVMGASAMRTEY
jgi:Flp pilus assembly protein TadG